MRCWCVLVVVFATFAFMIVATVIMIVWPLLLSPWRGVAWRGTGSTTGLYGMYLGLVFVTIGITFIGITETPAPVHTGQCNTPQPHAPTVALHDATPMPPRHPLWKGGYALARTRRWVHTAGRWCR